MKYNKTITLKDGRICTLRNGVDNDGEKALDIFIRTHEQTDFLLTYPDEIKFTAEEEGEYLQKKTDSENAVEIVAEIDGEIVGTAGIEALGAQEKLRHRCGFGVGIDKKYWGLGIGKELLNGCIECAEKAGFSQMELEVAAENERAIAMYQKYGFIEFGRNPRGFISRHTGYQELVYMRLEL